MNKQVLMMSCALGALLLSGRGALAAAAGAADTTAQSATTVGEVIVTAEKRAANIQDVPVAVTAFTAQDRNLKGINTVQDMTNFVPGLTYSSQLDRPAIRGLARNNNIYTSDSSVAVYYDDFFSQSTFLVGRDDMLIDQVEVLLGPQGTLYGRNAIGGLINTKSKRPTDTYSGEIRAIVGNYGYTKFEGTVSGPINDHFSFRLSAVDLNQSRGYFNNLVPGKPSEGDLRHDPYVDVQLQYKDDSNDIWVDAYDLTFNHDRGGPGGLLGTPTVGHYDTALQTGGQLVFNPNFPYGGGAVPGSVVGQIGTDNPALGRIRDFAHDLPTNIDLSAAYTVVVNAVHHFDGFDLKYVGGYSQYHYDLNTSLFGNGNSPITQYQIPLRPGSICSFVPGCVPLTVFPVQDFSYETHTAWYSHELTLSSTTNRPLQYIAGAYFYNETDDNINSVIEPDQPQLANPVGGLPNPNRYYYFTEYEDRIRSMAVYGQLDWKILPTVKLTGGLRYTYDSKSALEQARYINFQNIPAFGLFADNLGSLFPAIDVTTALTSTAPAKGVTCATTLQTTGRFAGDVQRCLGDHSDALTGTAGIEWTPDRDTLVYVRYNRGYKAFALNAGLVHADPEALPEHVDDFEGGVKKTFGRTLTVDADAFYYDYKNDQVPLVFPSAGGINLSQFFNIPKAVSEGVELTANWRPIENLSLSLSYGFDHTKIKSTCTFVGAQPGDGCFIDGLDTHAIQPGARPVGPVQSSGAFFQSVDGNPLPQAPENKVAFNGTYTFVFDPGNLTFSGTYIWKDRSFASVFNRTYYEAPSWDQVDLRATWAGRNDRYEVVLFVKNLFNSLGYDAAAFGYDIDAPVGGGGPTVARSFDLTPPRLYGGELHIKF
ncbi:MAG: TonB-dependent receptor [Caulobacteraceae bacterium]|nr:TonB-dependent receptor [Caulobacteraceae bacterium]